MPWRLQTTKEYPSRCLINLVDAEAGLPHPASWEKLPRPSYREGLYESLSNYL
jgi:hypothetical protein